MQTINHSIAMGKAFFSGNISEAATYLKVMLMMEDLRDRSEPTKIINGSVRAFTLGALVGVNVGAIAVGVLKTTIIASFALSVSGLALFNWAVVLGAGLAFGATAMILALVAYATYKLASAASHKYSEHQDYKDTLRMLKEKREENRAYVDQVYGRKANRNEMALAIDAHLEMVSKTRQDEFNLKAFLNEEIPAKFGSEFKMVKRGDMFAYTPTKAEVDAWVKQLDSKSDNTIIDLNAE